ncbi:MAG: hypothetical protein Q8K32_12070 [Archangium sp.]|nr:hypothetical protein [Archangium sp.]
MTRSAANLEVTANAGDVVELDGALASCVKKTSLTLLNAGNATARFSAASSSTEIVVLEGPRTVAPGERLSLELNLIPADGAATLLESELTIDTQGAQPLHFKLRALVFSHDFETLRFDFGAVEVGTTRAVAYSGGVSGLTGDFSFQDGSVRFSPTSLGPQVQVGSADWLSHCPALARTALLGTGVISALTGPTGVDFGEVAVGATAELEVTVHNLSFSPVLPEALGAPFAVVSAEDGTGYRDDTGAPKGTPVKLRLRFAPQLAGEQATQLRLVAGSSTLLLAVRGGGVN